MMGIRPLDVNAVMVPPRQYVTSVVIGAETHASLIIGMGILNPKPIVSGKNMAKHNIDISNVEDAIARLNNPHDGDQIIVRAMPLAVPKPSYDAAIINASMQLLLNDFNNSSDPTQRYNLSLCDKGVYEVVAVFHVRRVADYDPPMMN
jgi:hypothetical protein